jgi:carbamate kinase
VARELGADLLVILTGVPRVVENFGRPDARPLSRLAAAEARRLLGEGQFPPGSMGPKIDAALSFVEATGRKVLITDVGHLEAAMAGEGGTAIVPS